MLSCRNGLEYKGSWKHSQVQCTVPHCMCRQEHASQVIIIVTASILVDSKYKCKLLQLHYIFPSLFSFSLTSSPPLITPSLSPFCHTCTLPPFIPPFLLPSLPPSISIPLSFPSSLPSSLPLSFSPSPLPSVMARED